jgi:type VI secretion system protein ImpA
MTIEIEKLLAEISSESPCGVDLEYDPEFTALEQAARGKSEQQVGDNIVPAEEPDWSDIRRRAEALLTRTKDARVAMLLARALTRTDNIVGASAGLTLTKELLTRYWDHLHPGLDPDDDHDPTMRLNALAPLADPDTLLRDVRNSFLVRPGPHGRVMVRDIMVVLGKFPAVEGTPSQAELEGAIRTAGAQNAVPVDAARAALQSVQAMQALFSDKVGSDRAPDLKPLSDMLKAVVQVCDSVLGAGESEESGSTESSPAEGGAPVKTSGDIRSREDAIRMLNRVCEYLERTEPANPAPLFIRRAQHLMTKSFVEIIQDLAPDSFSQIQKMTGLDKQ